METGNSKIVQAEFLHFERGVPLEQVITGVFERALEGGRASTVVRIYDERNRLSDLITRSSSVSDAGSALNEALKTFPNLRKRPAGAVKEILKLMDCIQVLESRTHEEAVACFIKELEHAVKTKRPIAVDEVDYSFRFARDNELHELINSAKRAASTTLFMFPPNDLLADRHESSLVSMP